MEFDYERKTRSHYQDDATAETYHDAFASKRGLAGFRFRVVAQAERTAIERMVRKIPHARVLDIPTGTGKLAELFTRLGSEVTACDVSPNMLRIAKQEYARAGHKAAKFSVEDATNLESFRTDEFDAVVCLRLLHRVPPEVRLQMLSEFARVGKNVIVSYGIETAFHRTRRQLRNMIAGGGNAPLCYCSINTAKAELRRSFHIVDSAWTLKFVSQEMVFLLRPKT